MTPKPGRPRDPNVDAAVLDAVVALLRSGGYATVRMDEVARRSGVAKTTIYRRWPGIPHLAVAALERALGNRVPVVTGSVEEELAELIRVGGSGWGEDMTVLAALALDVHRQGDAELQSMYRERLIDPLRDRLIALITRGQEEGIFRAPAQPRELADAVIGGLLYRVAVLRDQVGADDAVYFARSVVGCGQRVPPAGLEPATHGLKVHCSAN